MFDIFFILYAVVVFYFFTFRRKQGYRRLMGRELGILMFAIMGIIVVITDIIRAI